MPPRAALRVVLLGPVIGAAVLTLGCPLAAAVTISPLPGTPDASPQTQISFLGAAPSDIADVSISASRSGPHTGHLAAYSTGTGASFLPDHAFDPGERVRVDARIGGQPVSSTFTVARPVPYQFKPTTTHPPARPGTVQHFVSAPNLQPPAVSVTESSPRAAAGDIFLSPDSSPGEWGPLVMSPNGQVVWFEPVPTGQIGMDFQVERYHDQPALVWWQGYISPLGVGSGTDEIYNSSYQPIAEVSGGNGYSADLHDIQLTPQGTAFITAYSFVAADLSSAHGPSHGELLDSIVQEIDVKTGLVMFEWHSYGHVALTDSYTVPVHGMPWDYFHGNSISQGPDGNPLVSSRNTWAAYDVSLATGRVLWRLGGRHSSFHMGPGTGTAYQHDARWQPDHTITIFDDGAAPKAHAQSRAIREQINWATHSVSLVDRFVHAPALVSDSQGNEQPLANGDTFVGWGQEPFETEFAPDGQLVFQAQIASPGQSYRAFSFPWVGTPAAPPQLAVSASSAGAATVYASWNGATDVSAWRVLAGPSPAALRSLTTARRSSFETAIPVSSAAQTFAVQALDASGRVLGTSAPAPR